MEAVARVDRISHRLDEFEVSTLRLWQSEKMFGSEKMQRLVILGAGGNGRIAAEIAELSGWKQVVFLDPNWESHRQSGIWPVIDDDRTDVLMSQPQDSFFFVGVGDNKKRAFLQKRLEDLNLPIATLVHPKAIVSSYADVAPGCLISAGAVVNIGCKIERGAIVNTNASIDHDSSVGAFCHVAPGSQIAADVTLGERVFIGVGASVRNGITILAGAVVGAGATVIKTVEAEQLVAGTPARPLIRNDR